MNVQRYALFFIGLALAGLSPIASGQLPKLLIKFPTRERPQKFFKMLDLYYQHLSGAVPVHFLISCDTDDHAMNCPESIERLRGYEHLSFYFSESHGKVEAVNRDIEKHADFDVILVASDDMTPIKQGYDEIIVRAMQQYFPDYDGVLNFHDGHVGAELNTLPIMGKKYYDRFGWVYYPGYISVACDLEFTLVSKLLNRQAIIDEVIIRHDHGGYGFDKDALFYKNESKEYLKHDKNVVQQRMARNFDLSDEAVRTDILPSSRYLFGSGKEPVKWSILVPTINGREEQYTRLYQKLLRQIEDAQLWHVVEVVHFKDNCVRSVGFKRNQLMDLCAGEYISYVDDDDDVSDDYVPMIYSKLLNNPDCVALEGVITVCGNNPRRFIHSVYYRHYAENSTTYFRPPNHLNPIKRSIAQQFRFPDQSHSEDTDWAMQICRAGVLKQEERVDKPYYFYLFDPNKSATVKHAEAVRRMRGAK